MVVMRFEKPALVVKCLSDIIGLMPTGMHYSEICNENHAALCALGANWLIRNHKCTGVLVEKGCGATNEMPDVLGFYHDESYLIEAKTSRSDFLADAKKPHRQQPETGMGQKRYYICPKDLIKPEELPDKWGLLYVSPKGRITKAKNAENQECDRNAEFVMLTSALGSPWKLFQHWSEGTIQRLSEIGWMNKITEADMKSFAARIAVSMLHKN